MWVKEYVDYLVELNNVNEYNVNLLVLVVNEDGSVIEVEFKLLFVVFICFVIRMVDDIFELYKK